MSGGTCYVCGSPELVDVSDPRNPLCQQHLPARLHKVSMRTEPGHSVAVCSCGWQNRTSWASRKLVQDAAIEQHWRDASQVAA